MKTGILIFCLLFFPLLSQANDLPYKDGEVLNFDIRYKYGIMMLKAGNADYQTDKENYENIPAYKTTLHFKTTSFFDKIFKIRDTLYTYTTMEAEPIHHIRYIHEGSTHHMEETRFNEFGQTRTEARTIRKTDAGIKLDTLMVSEVPGFDFLSIFTHIRTWDYSAIPIEATRNIAVFVGRKQINVIVRFKGQTILERNERLKYKAYKLELDIADNVFNESKNAVEAWISDDKNRIPLKIKGKLRIGAAEIDLINHKGLKYPFDSEIRIPAR